MALFKKIFGSKKDKKAEKAKAATIEAQKNEEDELIAAGILEAKPDAKKPAAKAEVKTEE